jgi:hypothetical protein
MSMSEARFGRLKLEHAVIVDIVDQWAKVPIFHHYGGDRYWEGGAWEEFTTCGLILRRNFGSGLEREAISLPRIHALKFSRPCRRCFTNPFSTDAVSSDS